MTTLVERISKKRKKAVERKQWSDMEAKFGHKADIWTIIFKNRFDGFEWVSRWTHVLYIT